MPPKVYVVVLNWNNWRDTLECLESIFRLDYPAFEVVVCDNASTDGSVAMIEQWASGMLLARARSDHPAIRTLSEPPIAKPISIAVVADDGEAAANTSPAALTIVALKENRGYASGNNAGIRYGLRRGDASFFWILNNDTVVEAGALTALVARARDDARVGLCGSLLLLYDDPERIQGAGGGYYRKTTAVPLILGAGEPRDSLPSAAAIERKMSYVIGASVLATAEFIRDVGLMREDYFLYFEEVDWIMRADGRFRLGFAPGSVVYHKEGASAGSASDWRTRSRISDLCAIRNRLLITRRFFRAYYPIVYLTVVAAFFRRLLRRQPARALEVLRILRDPESYRLPAADAVERPAQ